MMASTMSDGLQTLIVNISSNKIHQDNSTDNGTLTPTEGSDNSTISEMPVYAQTIWVLLYSAIVILATGGNVLVCYVVLAYQRMRTVTNYFIVNLAISDILMAVLCIPLSFVANVLFNHWPFGSALCSVVPYAQTVAVFASAFTLVAISVDRFIAIIYPLRQRLTTKQVLIIVAVVWVSSLTVPLPTAIFSKVTVNESRCYEVWGQDERFSYSLAIMVLQYFLPLSVLIVTYLGIGIVIWVKKPPGEAENNRDQRMAASKRKMVKMMIIVVAFYAFCWLPLHAFQIAGDINPNMYEFEHIQTVWTCIHWLAMSNSCINPIIYCWMNTKFRNGFRYALRWLPCISDHVEENGERSKMIRTQGTSVRSTKGYILTNKHDSVEYSMSPMHTTSCISQRDDKSLLNQKSNGDFFENPAHKNGGDSIKNYMTRRPSSETPPNSSPIKRQELLQRLTSEVDVTSDD